MIAIAGQDSRLIIFNIFPTLIGYWTIIWIVLTAEEQMFHGSNGYNWESWKTRELLPFAITTTISFVVGWIGAILCMYEVYTLGSSLH